jgi:hypothetical protein
MTQLPPDDKQWQEFLRQYRPTPPPAAVDLEHQVMHAIDRTPQQPPINWRLWAIPSAIAAGLLMTLSGYRLLMPLPEPSNAASLEAFLENNWNEVVGEPPVNLPNNNLQSDVMLEATAAR